jgi:hypothetical protein
MGDGDGARPIDLEVLAAFADGELAPEAAARVVMHLADHPEDQAYVDRIAVERTLLTRAYGPIASEPVPERIRAAIEGRPPGKARVLPFLTQRRRLAGLAAGLAAAAAAVVLAVQLGGPRPVGPGVEGGAAPALAVGPVAPESPLAAALDARTSGEEVDLAPGARLSVAASFSDARGRLCREVAVVRDRQARLEQAVACTDGAGWAVEIAASTPLAAGEEGFVPAAGPGSRAIERLLDEIGAGPALSPEEEAAARARGWRP